MAEPMRCGLVLLAAGASRRMGRPKQLLPINGVPLVRHVAATLVAAPVRPCVVVLGAHAGAVETALAGLPLHCVMHPGWAGGLGSSLGAGVESALALAPDLQGIIVALADQPGVTADHCARLIAAFGSGGRSIVASRTGQARVPPVLFGSGWFGQLRALAGDAGARSLLQAHQAETALVELATNTDLDTPDDYDRYTAAPTG